MELLIGTRRWSTWSLRPWLVLERMGAPFAEIPITLRQGPATTAAILEHSPSGFLPALKDGDLTVWDSLAVCEYLAERFPAATLWPADRTARAMARSATAEMHAGFGPLRSECPMALEAPVSHPELSDAAQANVRRIATLWGDMLARFGGPFLAGGWSIADAYYTPVATRFRTYGIDLTRFGGSSAAQAYGERLLQQPEFLKWERLALEEAR